MRQRELSGSRSGLCPHGASDPRHRHPRAGRHRRPPALGLLRYLALDATPRRRPINSPHGSGTKRSLAGVQIKSKHAKEKPGAESGLRKEGKSGAPARGVGDGGRSSRAGVRELNARPRHRFQKFSPKKVSPGGHWHAGAFCRHYQDTRTLTANCYRSATDASSKQRHTRAPRNGRTSRSWPLGATTLGSTPLGCLTWSAC